MSARTPFPIAIGTHISCLCGVWHVRMDGSCELGRDRAVWASALKVKRQKVRGFVLVNGILTRKSTIRMLKTKMGRRFSPKITVCIGFQLRSYNAKARLYGGEVLTP